MVAAAPLVGLALTAGAAAMQYSAAQAANRARERATNQWISYQKQKQRTQQMKDEENRRKAEAAQQASAKGLGETPQAVEAETQRLNADLNTDNTMEIAPEATVNDALLSGQGTNLGYKEYAAKQLNAAAKDARSKTAALAAMQAYTSSQFGMNNRTGRILNDSNQIIDLQNNFRRGDLGVYGLAKGIQPLQVPDPSGAALGGPLAQIGGSLMGGAAGGPSLGQSLSAMF